ncbi:hypothetical protein TTRE_0000622301 [Trichuris trichiura]|uniref:Uncharacterized protein n=1 Tax=Trichuris trichiura TaxID=36087 RepID=A0A077ZEF7_TRITR|nr:hypothetical protein TTRE_0000622301 [Trichuris trichiura]
MEKRKTAGGNKASAAQTPTSPKPKQAKKNPKMTRNWEDPAVEVGSTVRASAFGVQKSERTVLKNKRTRIIAIVILLFVIVLCVIAVIASASGGPKRSETVFSYTMPSEKPPMLRGLPEHDKNFTSTEEEQ